VVGFQDPACPDLVTVESRFQDPACPDLVTVENLVVDQRDRRSGRSAAEPAFTPRQSAVSLVA